MKIVKIFEPGEGFGEIAIMNREPRTATLVCREETHLMVLSREGFEMLMGNYHNFIIKEKLQFFNSFSFFKSTSQSKIQHMILSLKPKTYSTQQYIYRPGEKIDALYFIKKGEVEVQFFEEEERET